MHSLVRRRAFSLVELAVVMAMTSLLTVNTIPAITQAREAARRSQCKNNLKQLGLALHNYHDTYNSFAPGFVVRDWNSTNQQGFGWMSSILPYVDQAPLYNNIYMDGGELDETRNVPKRKTAIMTPIPTYRCPSDSLPELNSFRGGWPTSNYSGNAGSLPFPRLSAASDFWPGQLPTPRENGPRRLNGIFSVNSRVGIRDIIDGTSNTLLVAERGASSLGGIWAGVTSTTHENDILTEASDLSRPNGGLTSFSSQHPGGLHFLLCDGSARWIEETIESKPGLNTNELGVYQRIAARNDGTPVEF